MPDAENLRSRVLSSREARRLTYAAIARALRPVPPAPSPSGAAAVMLHEPPDGFAVSCVIDRSPDTVTLAVMSPSTEPGRFWVAVLDAGENGTIRDGSDQPVSWPEVPAVVAALIGREPEWSAGRWLTAAHPPMKANVWVSGLIAGRGVSVEDILKGGL